LDVEVKEQEDFQQWLYMWIHEHENNLGTAWKWEENHVGGFSSNLNKKSDHLNNPTLL
jgi:hypothetical protein